jgi:hypothetical protein
MRETTGVPVAALALAVPLAELLLQGGEGLQLLLSMRKGTIRIVAMTSLGKSRAELGFVQIRSILQLVQGVSKQAVAAQAAVLLEIVDTQLRLAQPSRGLSTLRCCVGLLIESNSG